MEESRSVPLLARFGIIVLLACAVLAFPTGPASAVPPLPTNFVAHAPSQCGSVTLTWDFGPLVTGYHLYRGATLIGTLGPIATSWIDIEPDRLGATYCLEAFDVMGPAPLVCSAAGPLPAMPISPANWYNDVFPSSAVVPPGTAGFDRTTAILNTGLNDAACTGLINRPISPVDVITISGAGVPPAVAVDMVFRIKPGPGNYCVVGAVGSGLSFAMPPAPVCVPSVPGDGSFWGGLMAAPGAFATPGAVARHAAAPSGWDRNVWNSRPCNFVGGVFKTTDFLGANILPNGLFTPGTNVEYFFRIEYADASVRLVPDTNCVIQSALQGSVDGHRWEHFGVLPDSWKDPAYGGLGRACMLVVDYDDTHGDERVWASTADTLGLTPPSAWGAGTGWHAVGRSGNVFNPVDLDQPANHRRSDGTVGFISANLGQPGGTWDFYKSRGTTYQCGGGGAGALGGRGGNVAIGETPPGPTGDMLRAYYRMILLMSGDRGAQILGPIPNSSEVDVAALQDFLYSPGGTSMPRSLWCIGSGFAQSEQASHPAFLNNDLRATLRNPDYRTLSGNPAEVAALQVNFEAMPMGKGVVNLAPITNDVLTPQVAAPPGMAAAFYDPIGGGAPYAASVLKPVSGISNTLTLLDGFGLQHILSADGSSSYPRLFYVRHVLSDPGMLTPCPSVGVPLLVELRGPPDPSTRLSILGNPSTSGTAKIQLMIRHPGRVVVSVYDIAGRKLRTVADETFGEGAHVLEWDGMDRDGRRVNGSVYLVRAQAVDGSWALTGKAVILR